MSDSGITIIALCASYINTEIRLKHFFLMLNSWIQQEYLIPPLLISTSIVDDKLYNEFVNKLAVFNTNNKEVLSDIFFKVLISRRQINQFKHYSNILKKHPELIDLNPWTLFTDDDDIWHPKRAAIYATTIQQLIQINNTTIDHIDCPYYVQSNGSDKKDYTTAADVDQDIEKGYISKLKSDTESILQKEEQ